MTVINFNLKLKNVIKENFIDPYRYFCSDQDCFLGELDGTPIIYDKSHLTSFGAKYLSKEIFKKVNLNLF